MATDVEEQGPASPVGFWLGLVLFILFFLVPAAEGGDTLGGDARRVAAVTALCVTWWITRAIPIHVTSLLPLVLFPVLGIAETTEIARTYMHDVIILLLGGFFLGQAIRKCGLHERLALKILGVSGRRPEGIILGFMVAAGIASMWIPAAVTCLLILPVGIALIDRVGKANADDSRGPRAFAIALMLGTAYGAILGGVATPLESTPNLPFLKYLAERYPEAPAFTDPQWILHTLPLLIPFFPLTWLILTKVLCRLPKDLSLGDPETPPGPMGAGERRALFLLAITALLLAFRPGIVAVLARLQVIPSEAAAGGLVQDGTVVMFMTLIFFIIRTGEGEGEHLLDWKSASRIPWGALLLFGGGLAIAGGFERSGLMAWIGNHLGFLEVFPPFLMVLSICILVTFLTEVTWSPAIPIVLMPILADLARRSGVNPILLMMPAALSASFAFMMPVSSAACVVAFSSRHVPISRMVRAGLVLNALGVLLVTAYVYLFLVGILGMSVESPTWAR